MATPFEVRLDGATFSGESDGFGLPVVFLHAGVADRRMWESQMTELADAGFHVIAYDRRGHGDTESPDVPFSHLDDLEAILDQLSVHAAVFVGSSAGGALAIDFAIENPERTVGLVLVGTALSGSPEPELPEEAELILDALHYAEDRGNTGSVNKIEAHLWLDGPLSPNGRVDGPARALFLDMNGKVLAKPKLTQEEEREPAVDVVGGIAAPTLLVVGELDFPHILERHGDLSEEMENSFAVVLEDTAHLPSLEKPEIFNPLLLEFLDAVAGHSDVGDDEDIDEDGEG
ncbi:alpha/beta fold hydrolase [Paradevosia shaoguanensis]|uniref:alpha/beta fold hydrolase n=1 Tax=Paradevosia shaoguanensis TaxID=1335043 RepID=UPI00193417D9|nr:alpha/beta hydrolase [Paradevosia shaoguanensis]